MRTYIFTDREQKAIKEWIKSGRPSDTVVWLAHMVRKHERRLLLEI